MAFFRHPVGEHELTPEEFKKWLKKFDANGDGRISAEELREAIRAKGCWFAKAKANRVLNAVDTNSNGFIDDNEINKLVVFAARQLGFKIVAP